MASGWNIRNLVVGVGLVGVLTAAATGILLLFGSSKIIDTPVILVGGSLKVQTEAKWEQIPGTQNYKTTVKYQPGLIGRKRKDGDGSSDSDLSTYSQANGLALWKVNLYIQNPAEPAAQIVVAHLQPVRGTNELDLILDGDGDGKFCALAEDTLAYDSTGTCTGQYTSVKFVEADTVIDSGQPSPLQCEDDNKNPNHCRFVFISTK